VFITVTAQTSKVTAGNYEEDNKHHEANSNSYKTHKCKENMPVSHSKNTREEKRRSAAGYRS